MEPAELLRSLGSRIVADYREGTASSGPDAAAPAAIENARDLIPQDFRLNAQINVDWEAEMK